MRTGEIAIREIVDLYMREPRGPRHHAPPASRLVVHRLGSVTPGTLTDDETSSRSGISPRNAAATSPAATDVPTNRVTEVMNGKRAVSADTALRLARAFQTSARFWMILQNIHDLRVAGLAAAKAIGKIAPVGEPAPRSRPARTPADKHAH